MKSKHKRAVRFPDTTGLSFPRARRPGANVANADEVLAHASGVCPDARLPHRFHRKPYPARGASCQVLEGFRARACLDTIAQYRYLH
jgi:hypothetical protein